MGTTVQEVVAKFTGDDSDLKKTIGSATVAMAKYSVAGIGVATAALGVMVKNSMVAIGANDDLAKSVSISTDKFKNMALIFEEAGSSAEGLVSSMGIMQRNLADAASGGEATTAAFSALGLKAQELIGLSPDQQFEKIAIAMGGIENPTQRAGVAMDIFGRGALKMTDIFVNYAEKAKDAEEFQRKFNLSLSDIDTEIVGEAEDAVARVMSTAGGLGNTIAVAVSPAITAMSNAFLESGFSGADMTEKVGNGIRSVAVTIDLLRAGLQGFKIFMYGIVSGFLELMAVFEDGINSIKNNEFVKQGASLAGITLAPVSNSARAAADAAKKDVREAMSDLKNMESTVDKIDRATKQALDRAKKSPNKGGGGVVFNPNGSGDTNKKVTSELKEQEQAVKDLQKQYDDLGKTAADNFYSMLTGAQSFSDGFKGIMNSILKSVYDATVGKSLSNTISNLLGSTGLLGGGSSGAGSAASGIFSSIGSKISTIFKHADGGVVQGATMFPIGTNIGMMGEAGAEAIMPLTRKGGKLGVANYGGGGANVTQNINISTGVSQTVRAELTRMMPEIRNQSVKAWEDANKRNRIG
jgi:phage-related minor tail protein